MGLRRAAQREPATPRRRSGGWTQLGNMVLPGPASFPTLRIPISNQRASAHNRIAGISPFAPDSWCDYLPLGPRLLGRHTAGSTATSPTCTRSTSPGPRACASSHNSPRRRTAAGPDRRCSSPGIRAWPNGFLWDRKGGDDVDIWAVLSRRYYGQYNDPRGKLAARRPGAQGAAR